MPYQSHNVWYDENHEKKPGEKNKESLHVLEQAQF